MRVDNALEIPTKQYAVIKSHVKYHILYWLIDKYELLINNTDVLILFKLT